MLKKELFSKESNDMSFSKSNSPNNKKPNAKISFKQIDTHNSPNDKKANSVIMTENRANSPGEKKISPLKKKNTQGIDGNYDDESFLP